MKLIPLILATFMAWQCRSAGDHVAVIPADGLYDSAGPQGEVSELLSRVSNSILKIYFTAYYRSYFFEKKTAVTESGLVPALKNGRYYSQTTFNRSSFGTATVLSRMNQKNVLLSCAHIGNFPDTIRTYFEATDPALPRMLESVAIKYRSYYFVEHDKLKGDVELLARDDDQDLALFGIPQPRDLTLEVDIFPFPLGNSKRLAWGSQVYMMGFPIGQKMVTRGLVSPGNDGDKNTFMVDALFNRGFSGGVILGVLDGTLHFELVGLAKSISANTEYVLSPDSKNIFNYVQSASPYKGDQFVTPLQTIHYGVTYCVSADAIRAFIKTAEDTLKEQGYSLTGF